MVAISTRLSVLYVLGINDSNRVEVTYLSKDQTRWRYRYVGNADLRPLADPSQFDLYEIVCGSMPADEAPVPEIDVILNAVCDPDANRQALEIVAGIQRELGVPIVNDPARVLDTTRDRMAERLAKVPGLVVPRTARIRPTRRADVVPMAAEAGVRPPFLVREAGRHGGAGVVLVEEGGPGDDVERFAFGERDLYATEFVDFRSPDGIYRKYRILVVGGVPLPRHMIASTRWNVHARDRALLMDTAPELQEEEKQFLAAFSPERFPAFAAMASILQLDYFGVDFAFDDRGDIVVFESNCCFRAVRGEDLRLGPTSYLVPSIERIKAAMADAIRARAASGASREAR